MPRGPLRQAFKTVRLRGGRFVEALWLDEANGDRMEIRFTAVREAVSGASTVKRTPSGPPSTAATRPRSRTIPVNTDGSVLR